MQYLEKYKNQTFFSLHLQDPRLQQAISNFVGITFSLTVFRPTLSTPTTSRFRNRCVEAHINIDCPDPQRLPFKGSQVASKSGRTWLPEATLLTPISRERLPQLIIFRELAGCVAAVMDKLTRLGPEPKKELALSQRKNWTWVKERFS